MEGLTNGNDPREGVPRNLGEGYSPIPSIGYLLKLIIKNLFVSFKLAKRYWRGISLTSRHSSPDDLEAKTRQTE